MESQRTFLFVALAVVSFLLFQQWQIDQMPEQVPPTVAQTTAEQAVNDDFVPASSSVEANAVPQSKPTATLIDVTTDVLSLKIDTRGGDIVEAKLLKYDTEQGNGIPFTVMQNGARKYIAQSGLTGAQGIDRLISGRPIYNVSAKIFEQTGSEPLVIDLDYLHQGISFTKRFTIEPSSYQIKVDYIINNNSEIPASVQMYAQLKQSTVVEGGSALMPTYRGAAYSTTETRYEKYDFDDIQDKALNIATQGGWVAMLEHYFVTSWVPNKDDMNEIYTRYSAQSAEATVGFKAPLTIVDPGTQATTSAIFYVGPKDQEVLETIADNLDLTIDYGFLFMISQPLFWLLITIQSFVSNWGVAIIIITLIVKGAMYPLTKAQYTSMAKMRALQPKMAQLKERFGDDRQKMGQATMELYRKEKVNPAGGCLPLLIQMPIFLALYWVFLESVELRHAPFMLWIQDLSAKDPFYVLPILMGISMFVMQKLQPMTIQDPMQQKVMQYMPVAFTVFFFWFPSGLVLYWLISNVISIVQMKIIFAGLDKAENK